MPNRYANLTPSAKISQEYTKITEGFDKVQSEFDQMVALIDAIQSGDSGAAANAARYNSITEITYPTLKQRLDTEYAEVQSQFVQMEQQTNNKLANKVDKGGNEQITWGMLAQDVKENITGGNTPVVGVDAVNTSNVVDNAITSRKRTNLGEWGYFVGTEPVNFNFNTMEIEFPPTTNVIVRGKAYTLENVGNMPMNPGLPRYRFVLLFNTQTQSFRIVSPTLSYEQNEFEVVLATYRTNSSEVFSNGNFTIDGLPAMSNGATYDEAQLYDVFYRGGIPIIDNGQITFKKGFFLTAYRPDLGNYVQRLELEEDVTFEWTHNTNILWDTAENQLIRVVYPGKVSPGSILLFKNLDNKLVSGALMLQYERDMTQAKFATVSKNKKYKSIPTPIKVTNITQSGAPNGAVVVGDEYWAFYASNDSHTNFAACHRWKIEDDFSLTHVGSFQHNWGHCNSLDYREEIDTLIFGNGSGDYNLPGKIFIIPNASQLKTMDTASLEEVAIIIDVGMDFGAKVNVVWGHDNDGNFDIAHIITNDNKNIRRIQLGRGSNQFPMGQFIPDKGPNEFNGTFRIIQEFSQDDGGDVVQGAVFGRDGYLYVGLGHLGAWYAKQWLNEDGTIEGEVHRSIFYNSDGTTNAGFTQAISEYRDKLILRIVKDGQQFAYVLNKF